jgi:bifunctional non-homologous end joining protein LigD
MFAKAIRTLPAENALIDGDAVVFRLDGRSDIAALRTKAGGGQARFVAFNLLNLDREDLRQRRIEERRDKLSRDHVSQSLRGAARARRR